MRTLGKLVAVSIVTLTCCVRSPADVTLFVEEPYGHFGSLTPTGHAALYFSRVCAQTPVHLRRCLPGETGVVISRYTGIDGYDWVAMPLVPYLYAVESIEDVPTSADVQTINSLRDSYRHRHLEDLAPDDQGGKAPGRGWTQLIGAAYIRKIYGIQIETTEAQDNDLIARLNANKNRSHFNLFVNNCADFTRRILDFYYPGAVHRSYVADAGITTPKQLASSMVKFGKRYHVFVTAFYIPQVPGNEPRSHKMRGVCEAFIKTKKYIVPFAILHPWAAGGIVAAYMGTGHFNLNHYAETEIRPSELPALWETNFTQGTE